MEVVEAAAAQLETLKFNGTGLGDGQGQAARSPGSVPVPERGPSLQLDEESPDTGQAAEAQPAEKQPLEFAPQSRPEPPPGGNCVTVPGAAEQAGTPDSLETSDSDSDSDRSGAGGLGAAGVAGVGD